VNERKGFFRIAFFLASVATGFAFGSCTAADPGEKNTTSGVCEDTYTIVIAGEKFLIPACKTVIGDKEEVDRAVVVIPGSHRDALDKHEHLVDAAEMRLEGQNVVIIHPQFLVDRDVRRYKLEGEYIFWEDSWEGWKFGYNAISSKEKRRISSFQMADSILAMIVREFPQVREIVIAGHSAGGQFVNRYTAANRIQNNFGDRIRFLYVAANPSSWLYFSPERFDRNDKKFKIPEDADKSGCRHYDHYKFGISEFGTCGYVAETGRDALISNFKNRNSVLLLGTRDNDRNHPELDRTCPSDFQGRDRLERGKNYFSYLKFFFGEEIEKHHKMVLVEGAEHSSSEMFTSPEGFSVLFQTELQ